MIKIVISEYQKKHIFAQTTLVRFILSLIYSNNDSFLVFAINLIDTKMFRLYTLDVHFVMLSQQFTGFVFKLMLIGSNIRVKRC